MIDKGMDKSNMYQALRNFPEQLTKAVEFANDIKIAGPINKIVISGMGGSALPGDILKTYLSDTNLTVEISREYFLTTPVDQNTLVFVSSFSGNTEETLASLDEALKKKAKIVIITAGGKLEELSRKYNIPMVKIIKESPSFQPRAASGYFFGIFVTILANSGIIKDRGNELVELKNFLAGVDFENNAVELAQKLVNHVPIIYTTTKYESCVARIIKIKFNENSKMQAFFNVFPELNHNEMVGWTNIKNIKGKYHFLIIEDVEDDERNKKRMQVFKNILKEKNLDWTSIPMQGDTLLTKIFSTLYLFDFVSYYLALAYGVDPTPVDMVEEFKKALEI
ncbi:MAG: bifunctional phosphoglucose/phosphomannose isomerase [bacterium]|nr:bifunctional phosphoglucose/phosphomannose isomerase [bacterium]